MPAEGVYNVEPVLTFVRRNANPNYPQPNSGSLRSVIGFNAKTDRNVFTRNYGACTTESAGSPAWMLRPGSIYDPLQNGEGGEAQYHLNYRDPEVQEQFRGLLHQLRQSMAISLTTSELASIDSFEVDIGKDGELHAARNYDRYPSGAPLGWMDLYMYGCKYSNYIWHGARNDQFCTNQNGSLVPNSQTHGAANVWRDQVIKTFVDIYGQELSYRSPINAAGKPMVLMVAGATANVDERASPSAGCGNQNVIDYAINTYSMGVKTTGITPNSGNGNWK